MKTMKQWDMDELLEVDGAYATGSKMDQIKEDVDWVQANVGHIDCDAVIMSKYFVSIQAGDIPVIVNVHDSTVHFNHKEDGRKDFGYNTKEGLVKFIDSLNETGSYTEAVPDKTTAAEIAAFLDEKGVEYNLIGTSIMWNTEFNRDTIIVVDTMYSTYGYSDATDPDTHLKLDKTFTAWTDIPEVRRLNFHIV